MSIDELKERVRAICSKYRDKEERARRLYIDERAISLRLEREREFSIRTEIAEFFSTPYSAVSFCGSAQLGFSIHQNKPFVPAISDLDAACISVELFQKAWIDVVSTTRSFTDLTPFGSRSSEHIHVFKEQILRRGMIRIGAMPYSSLSRRWTSFEDALGRRHAEMFGKITLAIYMNEYAFCWKQDSALSALLR